MGVIPINIIGKSIKTHRKRAGLTQQKLSGQICVHEITIRRWETGVREPRSSDIKALCEVLQVTESELLNGPKARKWEIKLIIEENDDWEVGEMDLTKNGDFISTVHASKHRIGASVCGDADTEADIEEMLKELKDTLMMALENKRKMLGAH